MAGVRAEGAERGVDRIEPRWPAMVALLVVGILRLVLPESLSAGPGWLLIVVVAALMVPTMWAHWRGLHDISNILGYLLISVVTLDMVWSLSVLVAALPAHRISPTDLLRGSAALWVSNILVFASWYERLDAGGPHARDLRGVHTESLPFSANDDDPRSQEEQARGNLGPGFVDYLFLSFNTSTAFLPTDCPALTRWAKVLMMVQALI